MSNNAHVISMNDAVQHVHIGFKEDADNILEKLAKAEYEKLAGHTAYYSSYDNYRELIHWNIREVSYSIG